MGNYLKALPILLLLTLIGCAANDGLVHLPNGDPQCPAGQWANAMNPMACATPVAAASGTYPTGSPPQITGYSAANVPEAETVSPDCTFTRAGANAYTITCTKAGNGTGGFQAGNEGVGVAAPGVAGELKVNNSIGVNSAASGVPGSITLAGHAANAGLTCAQGGSGTAASCINMNVGGGLFQELGINASTQVVFGNSSTGPTTLFEAGVANHLQFVTASAIVADITGTSMKVGVGTGYFNSLEMENGAVLSFVNPAAIPTLTAGCNGAGSSVDSGATDNAGYITTQTASSTGCTMAFAVGFDNTLVTQPHCTCTDALPTSIGIPCIVDTINTNTSQLAIKFPSVTNGWQFAYHCF